MISTILSRSARIPLCRRRIRRHFSTNADEEHNIVIVGGGVVGSAMADLISRRMPDLSVALVDATPPKQKATPNSIPNPRTYALSPASLELLQLPTDRMGRYQRMQVWEAHQPAYLSFSLQDLPETTATCLGACVEDATIVQELQSRWPNHVTHYAPAQVTQLMPPTSPHTEPCRVAIQQAEETKTLACQLLIAADGANSWIRKELGIPFAGWDYGQTALTFVVEIAQPMQGRAFQRFLETGPLALLPTHDPKYATVVWSTTPALAAEWKDHPQLAQHVNGLLQQGPQRLDPLLPQMEQMPTILQNILYGAEKVVETLQYGPAMAAAASGTPPQADTTNSPPTTNLFVAPPTITSVVSPQFTFPLACRQVSRYTAPRIALVGDAAHTVHPMAGQGLNLGLQDVASAVDAIQQAYDSGMDVASFLPTTYERSRQVQVAATVQGIHALHGLFAAQWSVSKHAKSVGMNVIQNTPALRRMLVQAACEGVAAH